MTGDAVLVPGSAVSSPTCADTEAIVTKDGRMAMKLKYCRLLPAMLWGKRGNLFASRCGLIVY